MEGSEQKHKERGTCCRQRNAHVNTLVNTGVHGGGATRAVPGGAEGQLGKDEALG